MMFYLRMLLILNIAQIIFLGYKFNLSLRIEKEVIRTEARVKQNEELMMRIVGQSITNWEALREKNPDIKVPEDPAGQIIPSPR